MFCVELLSIFIVIKTALSKKMYVYPLLTYEPFMTICLPDWIEL